MRMRNVLALGALLALLIGSADAAVTPNSIVTAQTITNGKVQITAATTISSGNPVAVTTLFTAGSNGSKCFGLYETNNDGSATHLLTIALVNSGAATTYYGGMAITTASNDGMANATPAKALMSSANWPGLPIDGNGNPFIYLVSGDSIVAWAITSFTANSWINLTVSCVNF